MRIPFLYPILGIAFVVAGVDKLYGLRGYKKLFRHFGWSQRQMRGIGAGEIAGGLLMALPATRRWGGAVLSLASIPVYEAEVRHHDTKLALPRLVLFALAASALVSKRS